MADGERERLVAWVCKCRQWAEDGATRGEEADRCPTCDSQIEQVPVLRASAVEPLRASRNRQMHRLAHIHSQAYNALQGPSDGFGFTKLIYKLSEPLLDESNLPDDGLVEASAVAGLVEIGNRLSGYSIVSQYESAEARKEWREAVERLGL